MNPLLLVDSYKIHHNRMYPEGMTKLYSNLTPRKSRIEGIDGVVVFGIQHFILTYLIEKFNKDFFKTHLFVPRSNPQYSDWKEQLKKQVIDEYKRHCPVDTAHIEALWDLGYLPLEIKALEEGTICPIGVPVLTITNTHPDFGWLVNYLETLLSCMLWQPITSATIAHQFRKLLNEYAKETTGSTEGVQWQGHDFSMRGMSSPESAVLSGMGHLLSFTGTDTIPAVYQLEDSYDASGLIGASVPATEHSVMCMGKKESELETFRRLMSLYPTGILSIVSDTWDLWKVCTEYLPALKEEIMARDGKIVIRPDSGDPIDIICGLNSKYAQDSPVQDWRLFNSELNEEGEINQNQFKGVIELLWDVFGGTVNEQGYKVLDSHIGAIYGDSINLKSGKEILDRLKAKGFASTNIVFGIGSFQYQYNTRDTFGFAMKATYGEVKTGKIKCYCGHTDKCECGENEGSPYEEIIEAREIFKDPITDDGTKKSKKGLLRVIANNKANLECLDCQTFEQECQGMLTTVFKDGKLTRRITLEQIRKNLEQYV